MGRTDGAETSRAFGAEETERDLLFHDTVAPHLAASAPEASAAQQRDFLKRLLTFQKKVESLVGEWDELEDLRDTASPAVQEIVSKRFFGKTKLVLRPTLARSLT